MENILKFASKVVVICDQDKVKDFKKIGVDLKDITTKCQDQSKSVYLIENITLTSLMLTDLPEFKFVIEKEKDSNIVTLKC